MNLAKQWDKKSIFRNQRHFCTATMKYQKQESGKKIAFDRAKRKIKYLWINLTKDVKDLYSENYTTLRKLIKEDTNKRKYVPCSWVGIINIIKSPNYPKQFTDSTQYLLKYQWHISQIQNKQFKNLYGTIKDPELL